MPVTTANQRVAGNVRAEMARHRVSQNDLAKALNTSQTAVWRRLRGEVPFDVAELEIVATALSVPLSVLVGGPDPAGASSTPAKAAS